MTNYRFEKSVSGDWVITGVSHVDTRQHWNWFRRFKWKGRLHISIHLNKPFLKILRYDLMFDASWIFLLLYLQVLAFVMAKNITQDEDERILMQPHLNVHPGESPPNSGLTNPDILTQIVYKSGPT